MMAAAASEPELSTVLRKLSGIQGRKLAQMPKAIGKRACFDLQCLVACEQLPPDGPQPPQPEISMKAHAANLQHRGVHGPNRDPKLTRHLVAVDCRSQICRKPGFDLFDNVKALLKGTCAFQVERICVE